MVVKTGKHLPNPAWYAFEQLARQHEQIFSKHLSRRREARLCVIRKVTLHYSL